MKFCMPAMSQGFPINANVSCAFASNMSMIWLNTSAGAYREAFLSKMSLRFLLTYNLLYK